MVDAGAKGFLLKNSDMTEVIEAIDTVINGDHYFSKELLLNIVKNLRKSKDGNWKAIDLSEREMEILELICKGFSNQEIGEKLFLSKRTIDKHRANILEKTASKNTAQLVMNAIKNQWILV
jgi:DNA-binding NarL/FixJ family response regulator